MLTRRKTLALLSATALPLPAVAQSDIVLNHLVAGTPDERNATLQAIVAGGDVTMAPALIFALRFTRLSREPIEEALQSLTGEQNRRGWFDWMIWQESHPEVAAHPSYFPFKRNAFLQIDPNFDDFLRPRYLRPRDMRIRFEEITWGGVRKDGIPSLDRPEMISAADADYLAPDDLVFGVEINGDVRAYPLRIMGWHEMFNDVIGGVSVALAYCTLCGSGILFETDVPGQRRPFVFGSSGFLYRSNKLMFDRQTNSLWNQFTGRPVVGPLVGSGIRLEQRPVVIDTWANWRAANPGTTVLSLNTGHRRDYGSGVVYQEYFASSDLMFPAISDQRVHQQKSFVFGIRSFGGAKAWPLTAFQGGRVLNDDMGGTQLVLIGDSATQSVRAFERGALSFEKGPGNTLLADGATWQIEESFLVSDDGRKRPRVAGHIAYWFAWNGYLAAESELFEG